MYLVDTNVVSALSPHSRDRNPAVAGWLDANAAALFISVVTIAEIEDGLAKLRREGAVKKASGIESWLDAILHLYRRRILDIDIACAKAAGRLNDLARSHGFSPGFADILILGIASHHGLTMVTRNVRHFDRLGVPVYNPWGA